MVRTGGESVHPVAATWLGCKKRFPSQHSKKWGEYWCNLCTNARGKNVRYRTEKATNAGLALPSCDHKIVRMSEFAFISCRVTSEKKALLRRLAEREGITESTLVRQLLDVVLRTAGLEGSPTIEPPERVNREGQVHVRLEPEDLRLLRERSKARGMASATYLSYLARSHLRGDTPLPKAEYDLLLQAIVEATRWGRDLNQIARTMHQGGRAMTPGRADVAAMIKVAEGLRDHFKGLLDANTRSWREGHETSH